MDHAAMQTAAAYFAGRHDFSGFAANRAQSERDTVRTIHSVSVRRRGFLWTLEFEGDGFLYKMVRLMVGALTECATGKMELGDLVRRLEHQQIGRSRLAAPAGGLYLVRVRY
jgi:tRNA pseudouridine38-40 synthase